MATASLALLSVGVIVGGLILHVVLVRPVNKAEAEKGGLPYLAMIAVGWLTLGVLALSDTEILGDIGIRSKDMEATARKVMYGGCIFMGLYVVYAIHMRKHLEELRGSGLGAAVKGEPFHDGRAWRSIQPHMIPGMLAALFCGTLLLGRSIGGLINGDLSAWRRTLSGLIVIGLAYGLRRNPRVCATSLLVLWVVARWGFWTRPHVGVAEIVVVGLITAAFFVTFFGAWKHRSPPQA